MQDLGSYVEDWHPAPLITHRTVTRNPIDRFAALLNTEPPAAVVHDAIPPMWHAFFFTDVHQHRAIGVDGHPADGHFLPPIPGRKRMFAGGRLTQNEPFQLGVEYSRKSSLERIEPKNGKSGRTLFTTIRHEYFRGDTLTCTEEEDVVYRQQPSEAAAPSTAMSTATSPPREGAEMTAIDESFLFRFSALTNNAHRIHYDYPYTTSVEGFPGLVIHGPLLGLLALEIPRRELAGAALENYSYRLTRPAFLGPSIEASANRDNATWHLEAGSFGRPSSITAQAVFARKVK